MDDAEGCRDYETRYGEHVGFCSVHQRRVLETCDDCEDDYEEEGGPMYTCIRCGEELDLTPNDLMEGNQALCCGVLFWQEGLENVGPVEAFDNVTSEPLPRPRTLRVEAKAHELKDKITEAWNKGAK
jgi:hypothetical protein